MSRHKKDPSSEKVKKVHKTVEDLRHCPIPSHIRSFQVKTWDLKAGTVTKIKESLTTVEMDWTRFASEFSGFLLVWGQDPLTPPRASTPEMEQNHPIRGRVKVKILRIT